MAGDTSIGDDDPNDAKQSGIDDEAGAGKDGAPARDLTSEDIEAGNDRNVSVDQGNRSGRTSRTTDDTIELGK